MSEPSDGRGRLELVPARIRNRLLLAAEPLGQWDLFLTWQLAYFLQRLKDKSEGDGTLLDCTLVLYGSSNNSQTHVNLDYPLVLSGGRGLGLRHGQYRRFGEATPFSNLFVTMLHALGLPMEAFADRTGELTEALA